MVRMFGITSEQSIFRTNASPEQLERYATLYHFRYDPKQMERPIQNRPDYHQTTRAIVSTNTEAGQVQESNRRHNYREDLDPKKLDWLVWLSHNRKWYLAVNRIPRETEKHSLMMIGGKQIGGQRPGGRNQNGSGTTKSEDFFFKSQDFAPAYWQLLCVRREVYTHSVSHAHFSDTFLCVAYRHRVAWLKVFAVRMSHLPKSPSPVSCFIRRPCCSRTVA